MEDDALANALSAAREGDEWAIAELVRALQPLLLRYLSRQAPGMAEDLASETWLSAAPQLAGFVGSVADFRALLFTIARRRVVDYYRARSRRPVTSPLNLGNEPLGADDPAESAIAGLSAKAAIDRLVDSLPPVQAEVVLLRVVADLTVGEVARVIGRSEGAVRVLQHRALQRLAKEFERGGVTN